MISIEHFSKLALALPESTEEPHFESTSFRVKKKIFATLNAKAGRATLKLSAIDQDVFCQYNSAVFYPVPNKWGKQGWTHLNLENAIPEMVEDALTQAWREVAPPKLRAENNPD